MRLSAIVRCSCSELYKAKFAMPYREGGCVSALSIEPKTAADVKVESYLKRFERRVEAAPPGQCPLTTVASYLETGANQTCGKCVPCCDGLTKLSELMRELANCQANNETLETLHSLPTLCGRMQFRCGQSFASYCKTWFADINRGAFWSQLENLRVRIVRQLRAILSDGRPYHEASHRIPGMGS